MPNCCGRRYFEVALKDVDAVLDRSGRLNGLELLVGIELARPKLESRKIAGADQNHAVDDFRRVIKLLVDPLRIGSRQRFAWDAVVTGADYALAEVNKPTVLHSAGVQVLFGGLKLLRPVGIGVAEQPPGVLLSTPSLVHIWDVGREGAQRSDNLEKDQSGEDVSPSALPSNERHGCAANQHPEERIDRQDVPYPDVHVRTHGDRKIDGRREDEEEDFTPAGQLSRNN